MTSRRSGPSDNRTARSGPRPDRTQPRPDSNPQASYERYLALAGARALAGDRIEAERFFQHAEHYRRVLNGTAA